MNKLTFYNVKRYGATFNFARINKKQARAAYNNGLTVVFCPCNLHPFTNAGFGCDVNRETSERAPFETVLNAFEWYNCANTETGKYTAFYIPVRNIDMFTGDTPTAESTNIVTAYDYEYLKRGE